MDTRASVYPNTRLSAAQLESIVSRFDSFISSRAHITVLQLSQESSWISRANMTHTSGRTWRSWVTTLPYSLLTARFCAAIKHYISSIGSKVVSNA